MWLRLREHSPGAPSPLMPWLPSTARGWDLGPRRRDPHLGHAAGGTQDPSAGGLQSTRPRGGDPQATPDLVMGAAWVLDARQVVGPEGSRLPMEGLLTVGGPCATAWVRGLAGWPGLVGRGRIRKDSGTPKVWVVTGRLPLEGLCADGKWGWGPLDVTVHGAWSLWGWRTIQPGAG